VFPIPHGIGGRTGVVGRPRITMNDSLLRYLDGVLVPTDMVILGQDVLVTAPSCVLDGERM
jgi:hypothetical protein